MFWNLKSLEMLYTYYYWSGWTGLRYVAGRPTSALQASKAGCAGGTGRLCRCVGGMAAGSRCWCLCNKHPCSLGTHAHSKSEWGRWQVLDHRDRHATNLLSSTAALCDERHGRSSPNMLVRSQEACLQVDWCSILLLLSRKILLLLSRKILLLLSRKIRLLLSRSILLLGRPAPACDFRPGWRELP